MSLFSLAAALQTGRFSGDNREDSGCSPSVLQIGFRIEYEEALCTFSTISRFFNAVSSTASRNLFFNV